MIRYENIKLYTQVTNGIRFIKKDVPYLLVYLSENSTFIKDYYKLNIYRQDARYIVVPITKIPRSYMLPDLKSQYKNLKLNPYPSNIKVPSSQSVIFDPSLFMSKLDIMLRPSNYRLRAGSLLKSLIYSSASMYPSYKKILVYSVDITKLFDKNYINRKIFPFLLDIKNDNFIFDSLILNIVSNSGSKYRLLIKDGVFDYSKILLYIKNITKKSFDETEIEEIKDEEVEDPKIEKASERVVDHVKDDISSNNVDKIKYAVKSFLHKNTETAEKINNGTIDSHDISRTAIASILYRTVNNISYATKVTKRIPKEKVTKALKRVDTLYGDQLLEKVKTVSTSRDPVVKLADIPKIVDNKNPTHLFEKRIIDFQINLKNDIVNSFKTLETKEIPLKIESIEIDDKEYRSGEIESSDESTIYVKLKDQFGKIHPVEVDIPRIRPNTGTFRIGGRTKCLINQIVLCPISFPKPYEARFESSYSIFRLYRKETRKFKYLWMFIGSFKNLPLLPVLSYGFGFDETLKLYDITYKISKDIPYKNDKYVVKIDNENYIYFGNINTELKEQLVNSFEVTSPSSYNIDKPFGTKQYFEDLLQEMTDSVNISYLISTNFENVVDPVSKQVLASKGLPSDLPLIIKYMVEKLITGYVEDRNDLGNQRIRGSEVLVQLLQKEILTSYTTYKGQVLAGNKDSTYTIQKKAVSSRFIKTEIVSDMEYANPVEEMAVMTRVSPVGKGIGGIPNKEAIQSEARNVHPSYFGNIDPVDTPEGGTIGIQQQLAIGSDITNARGIFQVKDINDKEGSGMLSTSSVLIPFIENNDGARIMMADAQVKQMLPLKDPDPPIVMTGYESILTNVLSDNFVKKAPYDCKIIEVDFTHITIQSGSKKEKIDLSAVHLRCGFGRDTLSIFNPIVKVGQSVKQGDIIAEGSCVKDGSIALGKTFLTAYMPYKGYNYEDGIVINDKIISQQKLVSLHGIEEEILISAKDRILFIANIGDKTNPGDPLLRKTIGEIEELLGFEEDESSVVYGQDIIRKSPGGVIVDIDVFSNIDISKFPKLKELSDRTRERHGVTSKEKFVIRGKLIRGILVKFKIQQELVVELSDKLTGRYGNKGIVCLIEKDENMPKTPWGESVEIILNPIGVLGRMNIGQLYELYCGLISKDMAIKVSNAKSRQQILYLFKTVLTLLDNTKNKEYSSGVIAKLSSMSEKQFLELVNNIKNRGFVPIIIPPFKAPKPEQIKEVLKVLGLKTGYKLSLPEFNTYTTSEVPVGYLYMTKLEHIGALKLHSRATGPLTSKTMQPTAGKRREGGQRLGELDTYSILSYNSTKLLSELMGPLSDDIVSKNEMISEIITTGETSFKYTKSSPAKDLLAAYMIGLMLDQREMGD